MSNPTQTPLKNNFLDSKGDKKKIIRSVSLRIENIVVSVDIGMQLDLNLLKSKYRDIESKNNFPGLVVKLSQPRATILLFKSGKFVITGIRYNNQIPIVVEKILNKLKDINIMIPSKPIVKTENIVVCGDFHTQINLDLASLFLPRSIYEPEVFPGLIYKIASPPVCFLIFNSGKIICTGVNDESLIIKEVKNLGVALKKNQVLGKNENN